MGKVETNLETAAAKAGMDAKTARKYRRLGRMPSELTAGKRWRTREDPFEEVWEEVRSLLEVNPGLEAKTIFEYLQRLVVICHPDLPWIFDSISHIFEGLDPAGNAAG